MSRRAVDTLMMVKVKRSEGEYWWQLMSRRAVDTLMLMKVKRNDVPEGG